MIGVLLGSVLDAHVELNALVNHQIYPLEAPEDVELPYVRYETSIDNPEYVKESVFDDKSVSDNVSIRVDVNSMTYKEMHLIFVQVRDALEGVILSDGTTIHTDNIQMDSQGEYFDKKSRNYRGVQLYSTTDRKTRLS